MRLAAFLSIALLLSPAVARAFTPPTLSGLKAPQIQDVFRTFGANFSFRPLEPASVYGKDWGATAGLIVGAADSHKLTDGIPGVTQSYVPNAMIMVGAHGPYGFGVEGGFLPSVNLGGFHSTQAGGDVKWTFTELLPSSPCDLAVRAGYSSTTINYSQAVGGIADTLAYKTKTSDTSFSVSKKLQTTEPFAGVGFITLTGTLSNSGSFALFDPSVTSNSSYKDTESSVWAFAGVQTLVYGVAVTLEYDNMFGVNVYGVKVGMRF